MADVEVARWSKLPDRKPVAVEVAGEALVVVRYGEKVSVLSGLCPHRGGRMSEASVVGERLICGAHCWDFRYTDGLSPSVPGEALQRFEARIDRESDAVLVDEEEVRRWAVDHPMPFDPDDLLL